MIRLADLAALCEGRLEGDPDLMIRGLASLDKPAADCLSFMVSAKYLPKSFDEPPGAMMVREADADLFTGNRIITRDPYLAYAKLSAVFAADLDEATHPLIHPDARVDSEARLDKNVVVCAGAVISRGSRIGEGAFIGNNAVVEADCEVGAGTRIESSVTVCKHSRIGQRCTLSPGVVIGASGFGYAPDGERWEKIHQLGGVVVGDDVDIGANTTIDRGAIDDTVIGHRVKLDNLIQIGHNVKIGDDTIVAASTAIAGSTTIGQRCKIGGRVSITNNLDIADDVVLYAGAFVIRSVSQAGSGWSSLIPAQSAPRWRRIVALINRLETAKKPKGKK